MVLTAELKAVGKDFTKQLVNVHQVKGKYALDGTFITPVSLLMHIKQLKEYLQTYKVYLRLQEKIII